MMGTQKLKKAQKRIRFILNDILTKAGVVMVMPTLRTLILAETVEGSGADQAN